MSNACLDENDDDDDGIKVGIRTIVCREIISK